MFGRNEEAVDDDRRDAEFALAETPASPKPVAAATNEETAPSTEPEEVLPPALSIESPATRAGITDWLERFLFIIGALVLLKASEGLVRSAFPPYQESVVDFWESARVFILSFRHKLDLLRIPRSAEVLAGPMSNLERFAMCAMTVVLAGRWLLRVRLLRLTYVRSQDWARRTSSGMVFHSFGLLLQAGMIAWLASVLLTKGITPAAACGLLAINLVIGGLWFGLLYFISNAEAPSIFCRAVTGLLFGAAILLVVKWPAMTQLWTRAGATVILALTESLLALFFGASLILDQRPRFGWLRKPLFIILSCVILLIVSGLLTLVR
jgi:hypothetical protein